MTCFPLAYLNSWTYSCDKVTFKLIKGLTVCMHLSELSDTTYDAPCTQSPVALEFPLTIPCLPLNQISNRVGSILWDELGLTYSTLSPLAFHCGSFSSLLNVLKWHLQLPFLKLKTLDVRSWTRETFPQEMKGGAAGFRSPGGDWECTCPPTLEFRQPFLPPLHERAVHCPAWCRPYFQIKHLEVRAIWLGLSESIVLIKMYMMRMVR